MAGRRLSSGKNMIYNIIHIPKKTEILSTSLKGSWLTRNLISQEEKGAIKIHWLY